MKNKIIALFTLIILFFPSINTLQSKENTNAPTSKIIYVDDDGVADYNTIQEAIDVAENGDTIFVYNGVYYENVKIYKSLTIIGENKTNTIIDGSYKNYVVYFVSHYIDFINFTIINSGGYTSDSGIKINSNHNTILSCIVYRTKIGILIEESNHDEISDCIIHTNARGIYTINSSFIDITDSQLCHNAVGVQTKNSEDISIKNCYIYNSGFGMLLDSSSSIEILTCAICDNNDNQGGAYITRSKEISFLDSNICHNGFGVRSEFSSDILVNKCDLNYNTKIVVLANETTDNLKISNCEICKNYNYVINTSANTIVYKNNIYDNNLHGIRSSSQCDARYNWWGSILGPSITGFKLLGDRISFKPFKVLYIPWSPQKLKDAGSDWETGDVFKKLEIPIDAHLTIKFQENDTDSDGCPDFWEEKWDYDANMPDDHANLDPDNDGLNNIEECYTDKWGSDPYYKDIFLEIDWFTSNDPNEPNKPSDEQVEKIIKIFKNHKINLHVDTGNLGGGEEIEYKNNYLWPIKLDLYWDYFLHNDLNNPRKGIFHYGLISNTGNAGYALFGWDQMDSFDVPGQGLSLTTPQFSRQHLIISGTLHELGHTLKLLGDTHRGIDNREATKLFTVEWWKYKNYKSCMNYMYTWYILDYSDGSIRPNDFDDWSNIDLGFFKNTNYELIKEI